ncbi:MAG: hypothetical protein WCV58_01780 [Patescibacteria group bacterium]
MFKGQRGGFSFIQILIILALIAMLGGAIIYILKPSKVLEKSRDAKRFADIKELSMAVNQYLADKHDFQGLVGPYSSIDTGFFDDATREKIDSKGWIPLDFTIISTGASFNSLPIDPLNNSTYNYRLGVSVNNKTYEFNCVFERPENITKHSTDGGNDPNVYELGTDLTIL